MIGGLVRLYPLLPLVIPQPQGVQGGVEAGREGVQLVYGVSDGSRAGTVRLCVGHPSKIFNQHFVILPLLDEAVLFPFEV